MDFTQNWSSKWLIIMLFSNRLATWTKLHTYKHIFIKETNETVEIWKRWDSTNVERWQRSWELKKVGTRIILRKHHDLETLCTNEIKIWTWSASFISIQSYKHKETCIDIKFTQREYPVMVYFIWDEETGFWDANSWILLTSFGFIFREKKII